MISDLKNLSKDDILKRIKATKQGRNLVRIISDIPYPQLLDIYEARLRFLNSSEEEFNEWLRKKSFYAEGLNLSIIGFIMDLTRERVRQLETMGFKKLRHPNIGGELKKYISTHVNSEF